MASLDSLVHSGRASLWHSGQVEPGEPRSERIQQEIKRADLVVLLCSAEFLHEWHGQIGEVLRQEPLRFVRVKLRHCLIDVPWSDVVELPNVPEPLIQTGDADARFTGLTGAIGAWLAQTAASPRLPALPGGCIGREEEIRKIVTAMCTPGHPRGAILGPPGVGKSTVALAAAHHCEMAARFQRRFWVHCDAAKRGADLWTIIAQTLDMPAGASIREWVPCELAGSLLVLDNVETSWEQDRVGVESVLDEITTTQGHGLLITLRGTQSPTRGWNRWKLTPLSDEDACRLFLESAGNPSFSADPRLMNLISAMGGLPLAIKLIAGLALEEPDLQDVWDEWSSPRMPEELTRYFDRAIGSRRLTPHSHHLLRALALLPDGVAAREIAELIGAPRYDSAILLRKTALAFDDRGRLRMLAPLRDHVRAQATDEDFHRVHAHYFKLVRNLGPHVGQPTRRDAARWLGDEFGNLDSLLNGEFGRSEKISSLPKTATIETVVALVPFICFSGLGDTDLLDRAGEVARASGNKEQEIECLLGAANILLERADYDHAEQRYQRALELAEKCAPRYSPWSLLGLGHVARYCCKLTTAYQYYERTLQQSSDSRDGLFSAHVHKSLGHAARERDEFEEADIHYDKAILLFKGHDDAREVAHCQRGWALTLILRQQFSHAETLLRSAIETVEEVGDLRGCADCLRAQGTIAHHRGQMEQAKQLIGRAIEYNRQVKYPRGLGLSLFDLGGVFKEGGDVTSARAQYSLALCTMKDLQSYKSLAEIHTALAQVASSEEERARHLDDARNLRAMLQPSAPPPTVTTGPG